MKASVLPVAEHPLVTVVRRAGFGIVRRTPRVGMRHGVHDSQVGEVQFFAEHCLCPDGGLDWAAVQANSNEACASEEGTHVLDDSGDVSWRNLDVMRALGDDLPWRIEHYGINFPSVLVAHEWMLGSEHG